MRLKELFYPNLPKVIIFIGLGILLWFFPIFSKSLYAVPFINIEINYFSVLNFLIAYIFASFIVYYQKNGLVIGSLIFLFLILFFFIPKVASYGGGDFGWTQINYCSCIWGTASRVTSCCHSAVEQCFGLCLRNETISH
jgi:hypothetical protein